MKKRLDLLMVERALAPSREKAKAYIMSGDVYVDGQKAVNDGCTLVHPITKEDIPDEEASKYVAIVEGQHRYTAAEETGLDEEKLFLYEC